MEKKNLGQEIKAGKLSPERIAYIRQIHAAFWTTWFWFRCAATKWWYPHFYHVVGPFQLHRWLARLVPIQPKTIVVDIGGGILPLMAQAFQTEGHRLLRFCILDFGPDMEKRARKLFRRAGFYAFLEYIHWDFWDPFPVTAIQDLKRQAGAERVMAVSFWAGTYLPGDKIRAWVLGALEICDELYVNMLIGGAFDPQVLRKEYPSFLRQEIQAKRISKWQAFMALLSIPFIIRFGYAVAEVMPLWTVREIRVLLDDVVEIEHLGNELFGQTACLRITRKKF